RTPCSLPLVGPPRLSKTAVNLGPVTSTLGRRQKTMKRMRTQLRYDPPLRINWLIRILLLALSVLITAPVAAGVDAIYSVNQWNFTSQNPVSYIAAAICLTLVGISSIMVLLYPSDSPPNSPQDAAMMRGCPPASLKSSSSHPVVVGVAVVSECRSRWSMVCAARSRLGCPWIWQAHCCRPRLRGGGRTGAELLIDAADLRGAGGTGYAAWDRFVVVGGRA
ncbi:MAG: hypothetical protein RL261_1234, partial [Pseudomonadota bacterium]